MASLLVLVLKRLMSSTSNLRSPSLLLRPVASVSAVAQPLSSRLFNTNVSSASNNDNCDPPVNSRYSRRVFSTLSERLDPSSSNILSSTPNRTDQKTFSYIGHSFSDNYHARETDDGLHLRMDMPGLDKKDVKVWVEEGTLIVKGGKEKEFEDENSRRRYNVGFPTGVYKTDEIKAEMKNGVLKVFMPRLKEEWRTDVFHVEVE